MRCISIRCSGTVMTTVTELQANKGLESVYHCMVNLGSAQDKSVGKIRFRRV